MNHIMFAADPGLAFAAGVIIVLFFLAKGMFRPRGIEDSYNQAMKNLKEEEKNKPPVINKWGKY